MNSLRLFIDIIFIKKIKFGSYRIFECEGGIRTMWQIEKASREINIILSITQIYNNKHMVYTIKQKEIHMDKS